MIDPPRVIEVSLGTCRFQGASRAEVIEIPRWDWFKHFSPTPEAGRAIEKALRYGDALAVHVTMEVSIFGTGERVPLMITYTPLWFSDGTFVVRSDSSRLPINEYHGQSVTVITHDELASEP